jgi:hypothetical protein
VNELCNDIILERLDDGILAICSKSIEEEKRKFD